jgi:hypothetical protein
VAAQSSVASFWWPGVSLAVVCKRARLTATVNTWWSKVATLTMAVLIVLTMAVCIVVLPKYAFKHLMVRFQLGCIKVCCCANQVPAIKSRIARARATREGLMERLADEDADGAETLSSLLWCVWRFRGRRRLMRSRMTGTSLFFAALLTGAWLACDSICLRFVVLFMGWMSALYAVWDVYDDGVRAADEESDCTAMAKRFGRSSQCECQVARAT